MKAPVPPPTMPRRMRFAPFSAILCLLRLLCSMPPRYPRESGNLTSAIQWKGDSRLRGNDAVGGVGLAQPENLAIGCNIRARRGEIVEGMFGDADDVVLDELSAFAGTVFGVLDGAFPFQHGPAGKVVLRHLGEDGGEIDLAVAKRAEAPCPVDPALVAAINALAAGRIELGILDVEHLDPLVIDVDVVQVIELLQH